MITVSSKVNILLVDDNPESLIALDAILSSLNQNLVKARSGEEALRCLLNDDFAVILLDVHMPGMNGFETAHLIRERDDNRDMIEVVLAASGASVTAVESARKAKKCLQDSSFDVLVSDIAMPEINGYELIRYIRILKSEVGNVPAIALTACAKYEDQIQALTEGFHMRIPKPVEPTDLINAIAQLTTRAKKIQVAS